MPPQDHDDGDRQRPGAAPGPMRIFDLEGEDITARVIAVSMDVEKCYATCILRDEGSRFRLYNAAGAPQTYDVRVSRIEGRWTWPPPKPRGGLL